MNTTSTKRAHHRRDASLALILAVACLTANNPATGEDVALGFAVGMGGADSDVGAGIALDDSGNVYFTGAFNGTVDFDPGRGTFNLTSAGKNDIFIAKLDSAGDLLWAKAMGGADSEVASEIAFDDSGYVYMVGSFSGTADFDPGPGIANVTAVASDIFVSKLDSAGNFVWAKTMGGIGADIGRGIALDDSGNVYTTGYFEETLDFALGAGGVTLTTSDSTTDIFVSKLDSSGNFLWAKAMGGFMSHDIAVDSSGNVYTTGSFSGTGDFDPGPGIANVTAVASDIFVSKLDSAGNFVWVKAMGGINDGRGIGSLGYGAGSSIASDSTGNVYIGGSFFKTVDFDPGPGTATFTSAGYTDIFVAKLDSTGNFVWAWATGGTDADGAIDIALDDSGNVYTTGHFSGTVDFDPGVGKARLTSAGSKDIFVCKLDSAGRFVWAKGMGGKMSLGKRILGTLIETTGEPEGGRGIAVDALGNVYFTGSFNGTANFDPGPGKTRLSSAGKSDIFVSKLIVGVPSKSRAGRWVLGAFTLALLGAGYAFLRRRVPLSIRNQKGIPDTEQNLAILIHVCPHCASELHIPSEFAGQSGTCNKCGAVITAPDAPA